jgi:hypothetical protein
MVFAHALATARALAHGAFEFLIDLPFEQPHERRLHRGERSRTLQSIRSPNGEPVRGLDSSIHVLAVNVFRHT